jgi:uncharacterized membrane protein YedE/YeeE
MLNFLKKDRWSPYVVGVIIGIMVIGLVNLGRHLGVCCGVNKLAAVISYWLDPMYTLKSMHFSKQFADKLILSWRLLLIIGIFFGSLIASVLTTNKERVKQTYWTNRFGSSLIKRHIAIFLGSIILIIGTRVAGGCFTGHGITGFSQLSLASIVFFVSLFVTAIPCAFILYKSSKRV